MSRLLQIHTKSLNIDLNLNSTLVFTGGNNLLKNEILNLLLEPANKYNGFINKDILADSGEIFFDNSLVTYKNTEVLYLNNFFSLYQELVIKKDFFFFDEITEISNHKHIADQLEIVNDEISKFEMMINNQVEAIFPELKINIPYFTQETFIKKFAELEFSSEISNPINTIRIFTKLIYNAIERNGKRIWIVLDGMEKYLQPNIYKQFYLDLVHIAENTQRLNIFMFNSDENLSFLNIPLEDYVLVYKEIQQLFPLEELKTSIERNYPDNLNYIDEEFMKRIVNVIPYVGKSGWISLNEKNMVLLKVLKELLGDDSKIETSISSPSILEKRFLEDQF